MVNSSSRKMVSIVAFKAATSAINILISLSQKVSFACKAGFPLDPDIIQWFKDQVRGGGNYQSLINDALRHHVQRQGEPLESTLRRVIREEMHPA